MQPTALAVPEAARRPKRRRVQWVLCSGALVAAGVTTFLTSRGEDSRAFEEASAASGGRARALAVRRSFRSRAELDVRHYSGDQELENVPGSAGSGSPRDDLRAEIVAAAAALERDCLDAACRWSREYPDETWSADVERTLQIAVKPASILDVSCHQTLCRVHLGFRDAGEAEIYASSVGSDDVVVRFDVNEGETRASVDAYLRRASGQSH